MTSRRNYRVYLEDVRDAIDRIDRYTTVGKDAFLRDEKTQDAVIRQLSIVGEAVARIPPNLKNVSPEIPWKKVVGMRNILVHEYSNTSIHRVWDTVQNHLPALSEAIVHMLDAESGNGEAGRHAA